MSSIAHVSSYPTSNVDNVKLMNVMLYPIIWLGSIIENPKEPFNKFIDFSKGFIENVAPEDFT